MKKALILFYKAFHNPWGSLNAILTLIVAALIILNIFTPALNPILLVLSVSLITSSFPFLYARKQVEKEKLNTMRDLVGGYKDRFVGKVKERQEATRNPWPDPPWAGKKKKKRKDKSIAVDGDIVSGDIHLGNEVNIELDDTGVTNIDEQLDEAMGRMARIFGKPTHRKWDEINGDLDNAIEKVERKMRKAKKRAEKISTRIKIEGLRQRGKDNKVSIKNTASGGITARSITIDGKEIADDRFRQPDGSVQITDGDLDRIMAGELELEEGALTRIRDGKERVEPLLNNPIGDNVGKSRREKTDEEKLKDSLLDDPLG